MVEGSSSIVVVAVVVVGVVVGVVEGIQVAFGTQSRVSQFNL